jgi:ParB-like chromosome segregation protein Spo0J
LPPTSAWHSPKKELQQEIPARHSEEKKKMTETQEQILNIDELISYPQNAKIHDEEQIKAIITSIEEYGYNDPITVDEGNIILEGHGRLQALQRMGEQTIKVVKIYGLSEADKRAYRIAHNKLTHDTGFNQQELSYEFGELKEMDEEIINKTGFTPEQVERFMAQAPSGATNPEGTAQAPANSNVVFIQLFFSVEQHADFMEKVRALQGALGTENTATTILEILRRQADGV